MYKYYRKGTWIMRIDPIGVEKRIIVPFNELNKLAYELDISSKMIKDLRSEVTRYKTLEEMRGAGRYRHEVL